MKERATEVKQAFIYCRTSDDSEVEDGVKVSIETQEESGMELAKRHGYKVIGVFKDRNRSGRLYPTGFEISDRAVENYCNECGYSSTSRTRKEFGELLRRIKEIDVLIVRRADRLMRPLPLSKLDVHILTILQEHNIIIHSHDENIIDPNNPEHVFIFKVTSTIYSKYVQDRRVETKDGIRKKRDKGLLYFPPYFYGFRSKGHQEVYRVEEEIKIVQNIYKDFLDGKSLKQIARDLDDSNIPTLRQKGKDIPDEKNKSKAPILLKVGKGKDGQAHWLDSSIRSILNRTQYAGFQYKSDGTSEVDVPAFHPPIISREIFKKVQDKLNPEEKKNRRNTKTIHGLGGLLRCGYCGYNLYSTATYLKTGDCKTHKLESFRCITHTKTKKNTPCKGVQIKERFPKGLKRKNGVEYSNGLEDCLFPLIYKGYINHLIAKHRRIGLDGEIEEQHSALTRNTNYKRSLGQKLSAHIIDDKTFDDLMKQAMDAGKQVEQKLAILQKEANNYDRIDVPTKLYSDYASQKVPDDLKRRLFQSVIERIDVWHDHITVILKDHGKFSLKRFRIGKTFCLPSYRIVETNEHLSVYSKEADGIARLESKRVPINEHTKINVIYTYDDDREPEVIYGDPNFTVMAEGKNNPIGKTLLS